MSPVKDPGRYPPDWAAISRAVKDEAGWRCQCHGECGTRGGRRACAEPDLAGRCRAEHGKPNPRTLSIVVLTTAHLNDTPEDCDPAGLRAMCQACHLAYDTRLHRANRETSARGDVLPMFGETA